MGVSHLSFPSREIVPVIESDVFRKHPDKRFAMGSLGIGSAIEGTELEPLFDAYRRLRANVYIDERGMLDADARQADDTERDEDDERSLHIIALENRMGKAAVFGGIRLIPREGGGRLPIEHFFPEVFEGRPAPSQSVEVSRYLISHPDSSVRGETSTRLFTAALGHILGKGLTPTYAVVEPFLEQGLEAARVPLERIADPQYVPAYNAHNLGIKIDTFGLARNLRENGHNPRPLKSGKFKYWGNNINSPTTDPELDIDNDLSTDETHDLPKSA